MMDSHNERLNEYDPEGGHTREEADAAYAELFKELHGAEQDREPEWTACSLSAKLACEYLKRGVVPDTETARRLCLDIISDTKMFRAKSTTRTDRLAAAALANIAGLDIKRLAAETGFDSADDTQERTEIK